MIRTLKCVFVVLLALMCLFYALQNIANIDACYGAIAYVLSMQDHTAYPNSIIPSITNGSIVWIAVVVIIATELLAGIVLAKGAFDLWLARHADAATFNSAKRFAFVGAGIGIIVWFGYFGVFGGSLMQMWQTQTGAMSLNGAFQYFASCVFVWLLLASRDD